MAHTAFILDPVRRALLPNSVQYLSGLIVGIEGSGCETDMTAQRRKLISGIFLSPFLTRTIARMELTQIPMFGEVGVTVAPRFTQQLDACTATCHHMTADAFRFFCENSNCSSRKAQHGGPPQQNGMEILN